MKMRQFDFPFLVRKILSPESESFRSKKSNVYQYLDYEFRNVAIPDARYATIATRQFEFPFLVEKFSHLSPKHSDLRNSRLTDI